MGKKDRSEQPLGRALIKTRYKSNKGRKFVDNNSMLHTTEIQDGYDWNRLNLKSVTEESSFQEFLSTAELAGTEFQGEKLNIKFISTRASVSLLSPEELEKLKTEHEINKSSLKIPRRPKWDSQTTPEELAKLERESFLEWRKTLSILQEEKSFLITPFEKNLEFWRQLWRVVERSDVVVQIVDARNPLLFRCEDLEKYVLEVSENKINMILVNKADFLTDKQRQLWAEYFDKLHVKVAFFSAIIEEKDLEQSDESAISDLQKAVDKLELNVEATARKLERTLTNPCGNSPEILSRSGLIDFFRNIQNNVKLKLNPDITVIGLVGYPNVGKSSTINALMCEKKVSVSATPGKTKHFQTLHLDDDLILCDCPGLVMPSFVHTKADMVINGILPIDQMRDHISPVALLTSMIPSHVFEQKYGIMLGDTEVELTAEHLLNACAYNRGFMTANGQPDMSRAARQMLKDFVNGKLLYCNAPPEIRQQEYHEYPAPVVHNSNRVAPPAQIRATQSHRVTINDIDRTFFSGNSSGAHTKGIPPNLLSGTKPEGGGKPWKQINKHVNKNKREKLRRVYSHLDQC